MHSILLVYLSRGESSELPLNGLKDLGIPGEGVIKGTDKFNHFNII
jgi:hypothetical protein